jgi:tetratricopeptide (TPR) repeat protein
MKKILIIVLALYTFFVVSAEEPDKEEIKKLLGEAYMIEGDYKKAAEKYREILKKEPQNIKIRIFLADILSRQKEYDESIKEYQKVLEIEPDNLKIKEKLAKVYSWDKEYHKAEELYKEILKADPDNITAEEYMGDIFAYSKRFDKAISLYEKILKKKKKRGVRIKLADVLSWAKEYCRAIDLYDECLAEKEDPKLRLKKARVLGWAGQYDKSLKEYKKILDKSSIEAVQWEMKAKRAYWDNRVEKGIHYYKKLIEKDKDNLEAMFDLSQIYSWHYMWPQAREEYNKIINISPNHFRAKEALEKIDLISEHIRLNSSYEYFKAESSDRVTDINKHSFLNRLTIPINYRLQLGAGYNFTERQFKDFSDISENEAFVGFTWLEKPYWWVNGFYNLVEHNNEVNNIDTYGGDFNVRFFDIGTVSFIFNKERLENSSNLIINRYYRNNYKGRLDFDINKKFKSGLDYLYSDYCDDNSKDEIGADILCYISYEPKRFTVKYRYSFMDFERIVPQYFSPQDFSAHALSFNWRHFLNKEEIFFGADDLYYDLTYILSLDSEDITGHNLSAEINWDINKRWNLNLRGSVSDLSSDVYEDRSIVASVKYYF